MCATCIDLSRDELVAVVPREKTALNFVENSSNATRKAKKFPLRGMAPPSAKKRISLGGACDLRKKYDFSKNRPAGDSFHVMGKRVQARTVLAYVSDVEIKRDKVHWPLDVKNL